MDLIQSTFRDYRGLAKFKEVASWTELILKQFIMFILLSEMAGDYFKKMMTIEQVHELHKTDKSCIVKLFIVLYNTHLFMDELLFFLSSIFIVVSSSYFDAINNALALLIIQYLHSMGSKLFLTEL